MSGKADVVDWYLRTQLFGDSYQLKVTDMPEITLDDRLDTLERCLEEKLNELFSTVTATDGMNEFKRLRKDAERYRKLRAMHWTDTQLCVVDTFTVNVGVQTYSGELLDKAIDGSPEKQP
jgi:hypothetical protein